MSLGKGPAAVRPEQEAIDPELRRLLAAVREAAPDAYLVGGGVRDVLLGRRPVDLDFVLAGDVGAAAEAIAETLAGSAFPLDAERGQLRVVLPEPAAVREIDLSRLEDGIEADLARRDFTLNALAAPIEADGSLGEVIDTTGGVADLRARRVRLVGERALADDPLRLLRAVRLAVELDFELEEGTAHAVRASAANVHAAAPERQRDELARIFATPRAAAGLRLLDALALLAELLPEVAAGRGVEQPHVHHWDVFDHSIETVAALDALLTEVGPQLAAPLPAPSWLRQAFRDGLAWFALRPYMDEAVGGSSRRVLLKLAALLHDVAKPETKSVEPDGRVRFLGHADVGAAKAERICERLRFGGRETRFVARLVEEHLRPTQLSQEGPPSQRAVYRFFRDLGGAAPACLILSLADGVAAAGPRLTTERWQGHVAYVSYVLRQAEAQAAAVARTLRLLSGHDLMEALDLAPGPLIGRLLAAVEEAAGAGEIATPEEALAYAARLLASRGGEVAP